MTTDEKVAALGAETAAARGRPLGSSVAARLQALEEAQLTQLRADWRQLMGTDPPRLSRDLLVRALAYRIQENAFGGLSRASSRRLDDLAEGGRRDDLTPPSATSLRPGAKLVREWGGRPHIVVATGSGFDYAGSRYRSLTEIAKLITGAHWSGPRFFGLTARRNTGEDARAKA